VSERQQRKLDHVRLALAGHDQGQAGAWADVHLVHQSLPEAALEQVDLASSIGGVALAQPVLINAMTGGASGVTAINRDLALAARELGIPMAVGSQSAGLKEPETRDSYRVVRQVNPDGVILANVSAGTGLAAARQAVEMIEADLLQVHLNAPQEIVMREGDRDFRGQVEAIASLVEGLPVPVVVKECGFGLSQESARQLYAVGVRVIDLSGRGGTNFAWIEAERGGMTRDPGLLGWGIPTPAALLEVAALGLSGLDLIASGGIRWGSEAAKALAGGARAVGLAGAVLQAQQAGGVEGVVAYLRSFLWDLRAATLLAGATSLAELQRAPLVVTGWTAQWAARRGVDLDGLARR
jgi:isopentenyl-diphosphate delta-isomerase